MKHLSLIILYSYLHTIGLNIFNKIYIYIDDSYMWYVLIIAGND